MGSEVQNKSWQQMDLFNPTEEHSMLRQMLKNFVEQEVEPGAEERDREEKFDLSLFRKLGELGLLGITVPQEDGGSGMDATAAVIAHEMISTSDPGFCLSYLAHSMLFVNNFYWNSNPDQKTRYLSKVLSGEWVGGMCMTEPHSGTDVLGMKTKAEKKGDRYILNGEKTWITNGCISDTELGNLFLVYAKTEDNRVSSFLVEKGFKGFSLGLRLKHKTGMRASPTASLFFQDCEVPEANLIGHEGESVTHMMRNLEIERLTLAAMSLGIAFRCLQVMIPYSQERKAFGEPINRFGQIQKYIADSYAQFASSRCYVYNTARKLDLTSVGNRIDADGVKLISSTMAKQVADNAIQVLGGNGYVADYVVERLWRDAKLLEIGGGTLEAHEKNMTKDLVRNFQKIFS